MSKLRVGAVAVLLATLVLVAVTIGRGLGGKSVGAADGLATLKVGQWIRIEGTVSADSTVRCDEVRLLTGDLLDDDWGLKGVVQTLDPAKAEFAVGGIRVQVTEKTGFDSEKRAFKGFPDLRLGMLVEVEGTYLKNGRLLASDVDDESDEVEHAPWARNRIQVVGKVERVDPRKRLVSAMGFAFQITDRTRLRSVIQ